MTVCVATEPTPFASFFSEKAELKGSKDAPEILELCRKARARFRAQKMIDSRGS